MPGELRRGQAEVVGALATAVLTALAVVVIAHAIQLQKDQMSEVRGYASLLMVMQSEDVSFRTDETAGVVEGSPNIGTAAVYRAVVNATGGRILWKDAAKLVMPAGSATAVYGGEYVGKIASCEAVLAVITERGRLYTFCGLYRALGGGVPDSGGGGGLEGVVASISRLYPLLAKYLSPQDYDVFTRHYVPVNVSVFRLPAYYYPGSAFLYVEVRWDGSNWYVTYRRGPGGQVLDTITVPRSQTSTPYREYPYYSSCSVQNGVRQCFEVYATSRGWCYSGCSDPINSKWYFDVGMKASYRFDPYGLKLLHPRGS